MEGALFMAKKLFQSLDKVLINIQKTCIVFLAAAMLTLMLIQVVFRYFLLIPSPWSEDLARLALVWTVFLASALGIRYLEHPTIDILTKRFPVKFRAVLEIVVYLAIAVFGFILLYYGTHFALATSIDHNTSLRYPKNLFYWPGPVGGALFILYSCMHVVSCLRRSMGKKEAD
jgi:TRAP-type C4-dicarboxylate transport system permease small subunit